MPFSVLGSKEKKVNNSETFNFNSEECQSNSHESSDAEVASDDGENLHTENALPSISYGASSCNIPKQTTGTATLKVKRLRANDRERRRVNLINSAMEMLRKAIPEVRERRKISKLELLWSANKYIWVLQQSLLTGRTIPEIQQALAFYQFHGAISAPHCYAFAFR